MFVIPDISISFWPLRWWRKLAVLYTDTGQQWVKLAIVRDQWSLLLFLHFIAKRESSLTRPTTVYIRFCLTVRHVATGSPNFCFTPSKKHLNKYHFSAWKLVYQNLCWCWNRLGSAIARPLSLTLSLALSITVLWCLAIAAPSYSGPSPLKSRWMTRESWKFL